MIAKLGINTTMEIAAAIIATSKIVSRVLNSRSSIVDFNLDSALRPRYMAARVTVNRIAGMRMSKCMERHSRIEHLILAQHGQQNITTIGKKQTIKNEKKGNFGTK
jgi:hypothetical protein